jgi:hypothetical protein
MTRRQPSHWITTVAVAIALLIQAPGLAALEGGSTSASAEWKAVQALPKPSKATRAAELAARQEAIATDIQRLEARLSTVPPESKMAELKKKLQQLHDNYGWEPQSEMVYGRRSIEPMLKGQRTMPKNLLSAFIQLDRDLKDRGIDLIIMPLVPTPHFHAHTLVDGIGPNQDYYPGWTEMTIEMLKSDLEVIDTVEEFRMEAENDVLVSWANDFHTGSLGRQIAAKALAQRLQRYGFAKELANNTDQWKTTTKQRTGAMFPQRIITVNGAFTQWKKSRISELPPGTKTYPRKHPGKVAILKKDAPDIESHMKNRQFRIIQIAGPQSNDLRRTEVVLIGDSQLHSSIYGSGLPAFIMAEAGGLFRWGSKSWSGFSPPEIYREVVPDTAVQPRVVVLTFLPKYFWHQYDKKGNIDEKANKYKPRPLPPIGKNKTDTAGNDPTTMQAQVKITRLSGKPTNDPSTLDYDEALMHVAGVIENGPLKGREIGLRYWILYKGAWTKADKALRIGQTINLTLTHWDTVTAADGSLAQHQIFDDTEQDFDVPIYWVSDGSLAPDSVLD